MQIINLETHNVLKWRITDCCNYHCPYCIRREFINNTKYNLDIDNVVRIAKEMPKNKPTKVDLIGGEVTILPNLKEIIDKLFAAGIDKINITTNASKDLSYLADKRITLTCSYHPTETEESVEDFIDRIVSYKDLFGYVKIETVNTKGAVHVDKFIEYAKDKIDYMVEADLFQPETKGVSSIKKNYRYKFINNDTEEYFYTRNSFLKKYGVNGQCIPTSGIKCSKEYDYVYIEGDKVITCRGVIPVNEFHPEKQWHSCYRPNSYCTLCGNISVTNNT